MATVYLGRQHGPFGFTRTVAIKSMHPQFAKDDAFRAMFLDEATITARIKHPNVIQTLDIVFAANKLLLVMEFVDGASMSTILRSVREKKQTLAPAVSVAMVHDVLSGLHAAHEITDDDGKPLGVVHRDVSPHNVHVGLDGLARVLDFGIAKAADRRHHTRTGEVKGKLAYMAPEQLFGENVDRRADIYAVGVTLWEAIAGRRLFDAANEGALVIQVTEARIDPPSFFADEQIPEALDRVVMKALAKNPDERYATAEEMARALSEAVPPASRICAATCSTFSDDENIYCFLAVTVIFVPFMYYRAKQEETMLMQRFSEYTEYKKKTGMLFPKVSMLYADMIKRRQ
jgi:serine/threonine-protein kinase